VITGSPHIGYSYTGAGAAPLTLQVYVALLKDGQLDLERMTALGGR
jgi:hypothetical protein